MNINVTKEQAEEYAREQGWINYPTDSVEHGQYWHMDSSKAPFGPVIHIEVLKKTLIKEIESYFYTNKQFENNACFRKLVLQNEQQEISTEI